MQQYKNLIIIGTSHIAIESVREVRDSIIANRPKVVAIELDRVRLDSLMSEEKRKLSFRDVRELGLKGFLFNLVGAYVERKLGQLVNVKPGSEMKEAVLAAKDVNAHIALVDQDVRITMKRLSKELTWREKFRFVGDVIKSVFKRERVSIDLTKVPEKKLIHKLTNQLKKNYPSIYKVLIAERNEVLAKNLYTLMKDDDLIIAVMGAGHEDDVIALIKKYEAWNGLKRN